MTGDQTGDASEGIGGGCVTTVLGLFLLVPALVVCGVVGGLSWWHERDLRDLPSLVRTTAEVRDVDQGGKGLRDTYEVRFRSQEGRPVQVEVPVDGARNDQQRVAVAYVRDSPDRVRTVEDWEPLYEHVRFLAVICVAVLPVLVLAEVTRGPRRRLMARLPGARRRHR